AVVRDDVGGRVGARHAEQVAEVGEERLEVGALGGLCRLPPVDEGAYVGHEEGGAGRRVKARTSPPPDQAGSGQGAGTGFVPHRLAPPSPRAQRPPSRRAGRPTPEARALVQPQYFVRQHSQSLPPPGRRGRAAGYLTAQKTG